MKKTMNRNRRRIRDFFPPEGFGIWCRIEELGEACGYDAEEEFGRLSELPDAYPAKPGQDPEEMAEEHPMAALASLVRRFLREYPEAAAVLAAAKAGMGKAA